MEKIGLIGFGDLGKQVKCLIEEDFNRNFEFVLFDDNLRFSKKNKTYPFCFYEEYQDNIQFIVCLGYKHLNYKMEIIRKLKKKRSKLYNFVHSTSYISKSAKIGEGVIIFPGCNIDLNCKINDGVLLNNSVTISHDTIIGSSCFLAPGVTISGNVKIRECCFIGTNTAVADGVTIGKNCKIGIGSVITHNISNKVEGIGNPFKIKNINV